MRLVQPEFIYFNVKVGGSCGIATDPGQAFFTQFLKCLYFIECVKSNLLADNMKGVSIMMRQLDYMAQEH